VQRATQFLPIARLDDFGGQDRLKLLHILHICVLISQVAENVPTSSQYFQAFFLHRNISFNLFNLFNRFLIRSISRFGVLMPCVDFF